MAFARDVMRATLLNRKLQEKRNAAALAEEEEAQRGLGQYRPKGRKKMQPTPVPENKMLPDPVPENKAEAPGWEEDPPFVEPTEWDIVDPAEEAEPAFEGGDYDLDGVPFASDLALTKAENADLCAADFEGEEYSGKKGFTSADVKRIAEAKDE